MEIARIVARCLWEESRLLQTAATAAQVRPGRNQVQGRGLGKRATVQQWFNMTEEETLDQIKALNIH